MMSSLETSSPVSASTFAYLIRWPVFLLIWLKLIFSESEVAGYRATGQVTRERRKKPFQLARGAIGYSKTQLGTGGYKTILVHSFLQSSLKKFTLQSCSSFVLIRVTKARSTTENELGPLVRRERRK